NAWAGEKMDQYLARLRQEQGKAEMITLAARHNGPLIKPGARIACNVVPAANTEPVQAVRMKYNDGTEEPVLFFSTAHSKLVAYGLQVLSFPLAATNSVRSQRQLTVARIENGVIKVSVNWMVLNHADYGGWRFEREPEKATTCPKCDRFKTV